MHVELLNIGWPTAPASILRRGEPRRESIRLPAPAFIVETEPQCNADQRFPVYGHDLARQGRSTERLRRLGDAGARVTPGHDSTYCAPGPCSRDPTARLDSGGRAVL